MIVTLVHPYLNKQENKGMMTLSAALPQPLTRTNILKSLIHQQLIPEHMIESSLITAHPRNFFIDLVLSEQMELYYDEEQIESQHMFKSKRLIKLPFSLQIVKYNKQWLIDCQCDSITLKHFDILHKIGEGTYSQIYLVQRKYDRHLFCLKKINKAQCKQKGSLQMIKNQFEILEYSSRYKIKLYYQFEDEKYVYFVVDYCPFGDVYSIIRNMKKSQDLWKMTLTEKYTIWIQIAFGIANLHQKGLIYRDLKPENILIDIHERVRVCDFGFACKIMPNQKLTSLCGSYEYIAPEMLKKEGYDKAIDLYCLGLLFYELLVGTNPFEGITPKNVMEMKSKPINLEKKQISNTVKDLLKKLLKQKPQQRMGYESTLNLFKHQFFKQNQDLIMKIIKGQTYLKSLKYYVPSPLEERAQLDQKQPLIFEDGVSYNYLKPFFNVTENIGPKFQSA